MSGDPIEAESDRLSVLIFRWGIYLFGAMLVAVLFGSDGGNAGQDIVGGLADGLGGMAGAAEEVPGHLGDGYQGGDAE